jgi:hypothetical protein
MLLLHNASSVNLVAYLVLSYKTWMLLCDLQVASLPSLTGYRTGYKQGGLRRQIASVSTHLLCHLRCCDAPIHLTCNAAAARGLLCSMRNACFLCRHERTASIARIVPACTPWLTQHHQQRMQLLVAFGELPGVIAAWSAQALSHVTVTVTVKEAHTKLCAAAAAAACLPAAGGRVVTNAAGATFYSNPYQGAASQACTDVQPDERFTCEQQVRCVAT